MTSTSTSSPRPPHGLLDEIFTPADLLAARRALGLTQGELGARLGITTTEVWRKESGRRPIKKIQALAIRALLLDAGLIAPAVQFSARSSPL